MEQSEIIDTQARLIDLLDHRLCKLAKLAVEKGVKLPDWAMDYTANDRPGGKRVESVD